MNVTPISSTPPADEQAPATVGRVALVGAGPGDEGLLTLRGAQLIGQASLVVAPRDPGPGIRQLLRSGAELFVAADATGAAEPDMIAVARAGQLVVRLYDGDPLLDGGADDARALAEAGAEFEIVPGVPAATAVPAYAGIPLGARRARRAHHPRRGGEPRRIQPRARSWCSGPRPVPPTSARC